MPWIVDDEYGVPLFSDAEKLPPPDPYENTRPMNPAQKMLFILGWLSPDDIRRDFGEGVDADGLMDRRMELDLRISGQLPRVLIYDRGGVAADVYTIQNYGCRKKDWDDLLAAGRMDPEVLGQWFWGWYMENMHKTFHWAKKKRRISL